MFSLIIAIVAVAVTVVLIAATMYHGGDIFSKGTNEAQVAKHINNLNQIQAALTAYNAANGADATKMSDIVPSFLASVPDGWNADVNASLTGFEASAITAGSPADQLSMCQEINSRLGVVGSTPPDCSTIPKTFTGCCVSNSTTSTSTPQ